MNYRFYFNVVGGIPLAVQQDGARKFGWHEGHVSTYEEKKGKYPAERDKAIEHCRGKEAVWAYSFVCLVPRKKYLRAVRAKLAEQNTYVYEGHTGWSTKGKQEADIIEHAMGYWSRGRLNHRQAVEFGSKGGKISVRVRRAALDRMPKARALKFWRSPEYETAQDAVDAINSVDGYEPYESRSTAYRALGSRQLPSGPRGPRQIA